VVVVARTPVVHNQFFARSRHPTESTGVKTQATIQALTVGEEGKVARAD
jgi:hypothetical protein